MFHNVYLAFCRHLVEPIPYSSTVTQDRQGVKEVTGLTVLHNSALFLVAMHKFLDQVDVWDGMKPSLQTLSYLHFFRVLKLIFVITFITNINILQFVCFFKKI